jgi:hypothetical protein
MAKNHQTLPSQLSITIVHFWILQHFKGAEMTVIKSSVFKVLEKFPGNGDDINAFSK